MTRRYFERRILLPGCSIFFTSILAVCLLLLPDVLR